MNPNNDEKATVLIVDDDMGIASLERRFLEDADFQVEHLRRGSEALDQLAEGTVKLVVLDYRLPDMTGFEFVEALGERLSSLTVVVVTGDPNPKVAAEMEGAGVTAFLLKDTDLGFLQEIPTILRKSLE